MNKQTCRIWGTQSSRTVQESPQSTRLRTVRRHIPRGEVTDRYFVDGGAVTGDTWKFFAVFSVSQAGALSF